MAGRAHAHAPGIRAMSRTFNAYPSRASLCIPVLSLHKYLFQAPRSVFGGLHIEVDGTAIRHAKSPTPSILLDSRMPATLPGGFPLGAGASSLDRDAPWARIFALEQYKLVLDPLQT